MRKDDIFMFLRYKTIDIKRHHQAKKEKKKKSEKKY